MSKKVLILTIGCSLFPWNEMVATSESTWDSISVEGCETIFYFGNPVKENTDKFIYFPIDESYSTMGHKMLAAFEWVLANKEFDYVARVNSSCYVYKKELIKYVQSLPNEKVIAGLTVEASEETAAWLWGGGQFILSRDVIEDIVKNKEHWNHGIMEDVAISHLATKLGIPFTQGIACSIDKLDSGWRLMGYGTESYEFKDFSEIKKDSGQFFYRCKYDLDRKVDKYIMGELFKILT